MRVLWSHRVEIGPRTLHKRNLSIRKTIGLVQSAIGTKPEELRVGGGGGGTSLKEANGDVPLDVGRLFTNGLTIMESHIFGFLGKKNLHIYV